MSSSQKHSRFVSKNLFDTLNLKKPLFTGYMYKQSHIPPKNFNRRYFALYPKVLVYYDSESQFRKDVQSGSLAHRHKALLLDHLYLSKPDKKPQGAKFCFILHTPNPHNERREVLLVTETREDRRVWMEKLQEQNPDLLESTHHHHHHHRGSTASTGSTSSTGSSHSAMHDDSSVPARPRSNATSEPIIEEEVFQPRMISADSFTSKVAAELRAEELQTLTIQEGPSDEES